MPPNIAALRAAFANDPAFPPVMNALDRRRDAQISNVRRLSRRTSNGDSLNPSDVDRVFTQLAAWGFGEYVDRQLRHRARLLWSVRPKAVVRAARRQIEQFSAAHWITGRRVAADPAPVGPPPLPENWKRHRLPLAPGRDIEVIVPPDLRVDEARWIGDYLERIARQAAEMAQPEGTAAKPVG